MKNALLQIAGLMIVMVIVVIFALNGLRSGNVLSLNNFLPRDNRQVSTQAQIIRVAKSNLETAKKDKVNLAESPCLSQDMGEGYALDVIHDPRIEADERNQCENYKNGQVAGLVQILPTGEIVYISPFN